MTQRQLEKMIHLKDEGLKDVRSVVMIQCVGSRDEEHPYCSRVCCGHAVKNALRLKETKSENQCLCPLPGCKDVRIL